MPSPLDTAAPLQQRTLSAYLYLASQATDWARRLVMLDAGETTAPLALAAVVCGAAVLWVCTDDKILRQSGETGITDFQVRSLSEAIRILKNEIRKGLPVSVGALNAGSLWREAVDRGLQPYAVLPDLSNQSAASVLLHRGAVRLTEPPPAPASFDLAATWRERRSRDEDLIAAADRLDEPARHLAARWLRTIPRLFPRSLERCYHPAWFASKQST